MTTDRLSLLALALFVGAVFIAIGPDELALDQSCRAFAPTTAACERF